ncbi:MAG: hypothetical protein WAX89_01165 [Alphaproteobacteria bacterium]
MLSFLDWPSIANRTLPIVFGGIISAGATLAYHHWKMRQAIATLAKERTRDDVMQFSLTYLTKESDGSYRMHIRPMASMSLEEVFKSKPLATAYAEASGSLKSALTLNFGKKRASADADNSALVVVKDLALREMMSIAFFEQWNAIFREEMATASAAAALGKQLKHVKFLMAPFREESANTTMDRHMLVSVDDAAMLLRHHRGDTSIRIIFDAPHHADRVRAFLDKEEHMATEAHEPEKFRVVRSYTRSFVV